MARYRPRLTMPSAHHEADREFIESQLMMLGGEHQLRARVAYTEVFNEQINAEPIGHKKLNKARHEANIRLRKFVCACLESYVKAASPSRSHQQPAVTNNFEGF